MANPRWAETSVPKYLPDRVAQVYYAHGLFCSSYPTFVIIITSIIILLTSYPLSNVPLPGNVPQSFSTYESQVNVTHPRWFYGSPKLYVQQVIMKSTISPWNNNLLLTDAFRAPLAESFKLVEIIHSYQDSNNSLSLDSVCLHIENIKMKTNRMASVLPEYNCLLLSPANLWQQNFNKFQSDANLINTVYNYQNLAKGKISIAEMLFGLPLSETGVKRYPLRNKQRVIQFAVTLFMTQYQPLYVDDLHTYLKKLYPLSESLNFVSYNSSQNFIHIYFPEDVNYGELIPLSLTYVIFFLYMYFSVRKMEFIKSKVCMAFSAVLTVLASLSMTIGICFFFGLEFSGKQRVKQVFPYLVIIVGLENILILIKSVVSTTSHLDVKIRVAQGLSKEGWNITKNLLIEVTILTAGLLTFVPAIQEFCIFAIVGLLSDFFLQIVFFSTILSLNVECTEQSAYTHYSYYTVNVGAPMASNLYVKSNMYDTNYEDIRKLAKSRSYPKLSDNLIPPVRTLKNESTEKMSKRIKVVNFWARTRFVQRSFMVAMVLWISVIIYNADTIQNFIRTSSSNEPDEIVRVTEDYYNNLKIPISWKNEQKSSVLGFESKLLHAEEETKKFQNKGDLTNSNIISNEYSWLKRVDYDTRRRMSLYHWSSILSMYNITLNGNYITILPSINLVQVISPDVVQSLRNPDEKGIPFRWQSLAVALDPIDFTDIDSTVRSEVNVEGGERVRPFIPTSPMEILMAALLCITSVFVVSYTFVVLYRCICSRNYAEWRASWSVSDSALSSRTQVVLEALPIAVEGHVHSIECLVVDGNVIVSTCLGGFVKIWNAISGELITSIERKTTQYRTKICPYQNYNFRTPFTNINNCSDDRIVTSSLNNELVRPINQHCVAIKNSNNLFMLKNIGTNENSIFQSPITKKLSSINGINLKKTEENIFMNSKCNNYEQSGDNNNAIKCEQCNVFETDVVIRESVPIWCIDCKDNMVVLGCKDGCLEFWECSTGMLQYVFIEEDKVSITAVKLLGRLVVAAKLNGHLCFYRIDVRTAYPGVDSLNGFTKHRRGHVRTGSMDSSFHWQNSVFDEIRCLRMNIVKAHTKPITVLEAESGKIITGSEDRSLKVFQADNQSLLYTLHGHYGPITCTFIDRFSPCMAGSGSQDGLLCVWDLQTGACTYSIQAHDGAILALVYSASYVISLGQDERLCIWDRFQGHILNTIAVIDSYCTTLCMLTHNLLVTSRQDCLVVIDVGTGETVRVVKLGSMNSCLFIRNILNIGDGVVCDYGDQLRIVRFPLVCDKND